MNRPRARGACPLAAITVALALVAGCGGDDGARRDEAATVPDDGAGGDEAAAAPDDGIQAPVDDSVVQAVIEAADGDPADLDRLLVEAGDGIAALLVEESGLSASLGAGRADELADQVFAGYLDEFEAWVLDQLVTAENEALLDGLDLSGPSGPAGFRRPASPPVLTEAVTPPSIPAGSGSAVVVGVAATIFGGVAGVLLTKDVPEQTISARSQEFALDLERTRVQVGMNSTRSLEGLAGQLSTEMDLGVCPDADGRFQLSSSFDVSLYQPGSREGGRSELEVSVVGRTDDDAGIADLDTRYRFQVSDTAPNGRGVFLDVSGSWTVNRTSGAGAAVRGTGFDLNRSGGAITPERAQQYVDLMVKVAASIQKFIVDVAQYAWQSGRCVSLEISSDPATRTGLAPSSDVAIRVTPRSAVDGSEPGGTISATVSGGTSISPTGRTPAPADYVYVAPPERDRTATVAFEARSKRGVATAQATFTTDQRGYTVSGGGQDLVVSGRVESVDVPFTINGTFPGGQAVITYTPTGERAGTYRAELAGSGATGTVTGTYTITEGDGGVLTLTATGGGCVDQAGGGCSQTTEVITLTPDG